MRIGQARLLEKADASRDSTTAERRSKKDLRVATKTFPLSRNDCSESHLAMLAGSS